jgi:hypothetical protein
MRRGEKVDAVSGRLQRCAKEGTGRPLSVRARDVENGRQPILRISQASQQGFDTFKAQPIASGTESGKAVELLLDARMVRACPVSHQAAAFSGAR